MAQRVQDLRLKELYDADKYVGSISRFNSYHQCAYQYYLKYIQKIKDSGGNVWSFLGGKCHDGLENCINGIGDESQLLTLIQEELDDLDIAGIEFPKDRNGNDTIRNNWINNMTRFAQEFKTPRGRFETEQLIIYPIDEDNYMQGYIDVIKYNDDGTIDIIDWKTSSNFTGDHLKEAGRQLVLYGLAKELEGFKIRKLRWVMLKYCETTWIQKNGKPKTKVSEWRNLIKDLKNPIERCLAAQGLDDIDIEIIMNEALETNRMPAEVADKFKTHVYVRDYEYNDENKAETIQYLKDTLEQINSDELWSPCDTDKQSFFCASLCGYGGKTGKCKYWVDYCESYQSEDEDADLF